MPLANKSCMEMHIEEIAKCVPDGRHALVVMDGAGWHSESLNNDKVTILKLPPYSPELNPCEQIWQYLKDLYLANRCFTDYNELIDAICKAWNKFSDDVQNFLPLFLRRVHACRIVAICVQNNDGVFR